MWEYLKKIIILFNSFNWLHKKSTFISLDLLFKFSTNEIYIASFKYQKDRKFPVT